MNVDRSFPDHEARVDPLLVVADLVRSLRWWRDILGATVVTQSDAYALIAVGRGRVHLAEVGEPSPDRSIQLVVPSQPGVSSSGEVVISVHDCAQVARELEQRGLDLLGPPSIPPWGGEVRAFALDPDGHLIEFTSPH